MYNIGHCGSNQYSVEYTKEGGGQRPKLLASGISRMYANKVQRYYAVSRSPSEVL